MKTKPYVRHVDDLPQGELDELCRVIKEDPAPLDNVTLAKALEVRGLITRQGKTKLRPNWPMIRKLQTD